jgi:hypothetical protein
MELRENRTELERLLGDVWEYEDGDHPKTSLPKWLFALTLIGAVICTFSPSDLVVPVIGAIAPAPEKLLVDKVSSENVAEDIDYRVAQRTDSPAGWRAFLDAHPDGPHAQAVRAAIDGAQPATPPQPEQSRAPTADETAQQETGAPVPAVMEENEPAPPPRPLELGEQSPSTSAGTETPAPSAPPVMLEEEEPLPQPAAVAEQSPPPSAAKPVDAAHSPLRPRRRQSRPRRSQRRRPSRPRSRTRRCRHQDHARSQPQSMKSQRITVVGARSIIRPINRTFSRYWSRNSFTVRASAWTS